MIEVKKVLDADNSDVLSGTQLDQISEAGLFEILCASTVADTTITVSMMDEIIINNQPVALRANGEPLMSDDVPISIDVGDGGGRPIIAIDETTPATICVRVFFTPEEEID